MRLVSWPCLSFRKHSYKNLTATERISVNVKIGKHYRILYVKIFMFFCGYRERDSLISIGAKIIRNEDCLEILK